MPSTWLISRRSSLWIASLALLCWLASLGFTGLATYDSKHTLGGLHILKMGWLGVLVLNFAWFSNVFVLFAIAMLLIGRNALISASIATLLSLNAFSFSRLPLNEGGGEAAVYGYGFGAILWFVAIYLTLFSGGLRAAAQEKMDGGSGSLTITIAAALPLLVFLCASGYFAFSDRDRANETERTRLAGMAFKRGAVCDIEVAPPSHVFDSEWPVEVVKVGSYLPVPFNKPDDLLAWGVSTVWLDGRAYRLDSKSGKSIVVEVPSAAPARARLKVWWKTDIGLANELQLSLVSADERLVAFDQTWRNDVQWYYCPDYSHFPNHSDHPRRLIRDALGLSRQ